MTVRCTSEPRDVTTQQVVKIAIGPAIAIEALVFDEHNRIIVEDRNTFFIKLTFDV